MFLEETYNSLNDTIAQDVHGILYLVSYGIFCHYGNFPNDILYE